MNIWSVDFDIHKYNWYIFKKTEDMGLLDLSAILRDQESLPEALPKDIVFFKREVPNEEEGNTILGDMMEGSGTHCGLVSERAKSLLESEYKELFHFYPVHLEELTEEKYYILNPDPTAFVFAEDVLDLKNTEFKYLQDGDKDGIYDGERVILDIRRYTFTEEIKGHHFFRIIFDHGKTKKHFRMYCDDEFKKFINKNKITGLKFIKIFEFED